MNFGRILDLRGVVFFFNVAISFSFFSTIAITTSTCLNQRDPVQKKDLALEKVLNKLNKQHLSQQEALILSEAAEFGIQRYSGGIKSLRLKRILDFAKNTRSPSSVLYKLHVLYQIEQGPLKDRYLSVYVRKSRTGGIKFHLRSQGGKNKRSLRQQNGNTAQCDQLSKGANCSKCGFHGICVRGTARISSWLQYALKTQRELQIDIPVNRVQFVGAHNAFNNRASGYGDLDDCQWPVKDDEVCISVANQEFSFTDQLNMGVRHLELDLWNCFGKIRMSHGNGDFKIGCSPWDKELTEGMSEISEWTQKPRNRNEIIQIYFDDHTNPRDKSTINQIIRDYFGNKVLAPSDLKVTFSGRWPSMRVMRRLKKTVIFIDPDDRSEQCVHSQFWTQGYNVKGFASQLNNCSAAGKSDEIIRIYSDSTNYGPFWNGPKKAGTILNFKKYLLCGVAIPSADQINTELMKTAVFTWAEGEPRQPITYSSCVILSADERWRVTSCAEKHYFACVLKMDKTLWNISSDLDKYSKPSCPENMEFSVPHNGYEHQRLVQAAEGKTVWLNIAPFVPLLKQEKSEGTRVFNSWG